MIFIGCKIIRKMSKHILSYAFLIVELSVGILFFSYGMNFFFSSLEREYSLEKELGNGVYYLNTYALGEDGKNMGSDVTFEDYASIVKLTGGEVDFTAIYDLAVEGREGSTQTKVLYSNMNMEESTAFYGVGSEQILNNNADRIVSSLPIERDRDGIAVDYNNEKKIYMAKELDRDLQGKLLFRGLLMEDLKLDNCIMLPLRDYQYMTENYMHHNILTIRFEDREDVDTELQKICLYLQQQHGEDYQYEFKNVMAEYRDTKDSYLQTSQYIGQVSVLMLLVLIIGYRGVLNVFLERRKRELAICSAVGARRWQLIFEYVGEVSLICFMGILMGLIMGNILVEHSSSAAFRVRTQPATIVLCIGIAIIIIGGALATFIRFLFKKRPLLGIEDNIL